MSNTPTYRLKNRIADINETMYLTYLCANDPVSRELNRIIVSSRSHTNTLSTVLSISSGFPPPFWLLRLVLQLLLPLFVFPLPPLPELRFFDSLRTWKIVYTIYYLIAAKHCLLDINRPICKYVLQWNNM